MVRTSWTSTRMGCSGGLANWRLLSGKRRTDRTPSDPELVRVGERQQQDVAGRHHSAVAGRDLDGAAAVRDQMKVSDVAQMRHRRALVVLLRTDDAERGGKTGVEKHRSGQPQR